MKKRNLIYGLALAGAVVFASCGGGEKKAESQEANAEEFAATQPVASGEYRAVSFQYDEPESSRMPFDGRIIFSLAPENSGIYVYENGNRTHFKAVVSLPTAFTKADSVYNATDSKEQNVSLIVGSQADTLVIVKDSKPVKVAFEKDPVSEMSAVDAMARISTLLSK